MNDLGGATDGSGASTKAADLVVQEIRRNGGLNVYYTYCSYLNYKLNNYIDHMKQAMQSQTMIQLSLGTE